MEDKQINKPIKIQLNKISIPFQETFPKVPKLQKTNCCNCSALLKYDKTETTADVTLPNIKPIIKMVMVSLTLKVTDNTASNTKKLPRAEAITKLQDPNKKPPNVPPKTPAPNINKATPKLAPLLNPKTKGPAKGFLNNVCMISPETAKPPPAKIAVSAFGKR